MRSLREVTGIGPKRAARITAGWADQKVIREIMLFLHANGVGTSRAVRIYKIYGAEAVQVITENPYRLARTHSSAANAASAKRAKSARELTCRTEASVFSKCATASR